MSLSVIDNPRHISRDLYEQTIDKICMSLSATAGVVSVYQLGSVAHPGISDVDMIVIFDDSATAQIDPRRSLSIAERYLFTHQLFALPKSFIDQFCDLSLFHNFVHRVGDEVLQNVAHPDTASAILKRQIALEFLVKNYIDLKIQYRYKIVKLRSVLQHIKGLRFDLEFLEMGDHELHPYIASFIEKIDRFSSTGVINFSPKNFKQLIHTLESALVEAIENHTFFVPKPLPIKLSDNSSIANANTFSYSATGLSLPNGLAILGRKYFNLQHRLNRFEITIPVQQAEPNSLIAKRFQFFANLKRHVASQLPGFAAPISPLFYRAL